MKLTRAIAEKPWPRKVYFNDIWDRRDDPRVDPRVGRRGDRDNSILYSSRGVGALQICVQCKWLMRQTRSFLSVKARITWYGMQRERLPEDIGINP